MTSRPGLFAAGSVPDRGCRSIAGARATAGAANSRARTDDRGMRWAKPNRRSEPHLRFSFDMLGEGARTMADADRYFASYQHAIRVCWRRRMRHG